MVRRLSLKESQKPGGSTEKIDYSFHRIKPGMYLICGKCFYVKKATANWIAYVNKIYYCLEKNPPFLTSLDYKRLKCSQCGIKGELITHVPEKGSKPSINQIICEVMTYLSDREMDAERFEEELNFEVADNATAENYWREQGAYKEFDEKKR
jgi:ribosomal protein S27AE